MCVWYTQQNIIYIKHTITHHIGYDQEFKRMGECKQEENNTHCEYEIRDAFSCLRNARFVDWNYFFRSKPYIHFTTHSRQTNATNLQQINKHFARNETWYDDFTRICKAKRWFINWEEITHFKSKTYFSSVWPIDSLKAKRKRKRGRSKLVKSLILWLTICFSSLFISTRPTQRQCHTCTYLSGCTFVFHTHFRVVSLRFCAYVHCRLLEISMSNMCAILYGYE